MVSEETLYMIIAVSLTVFGSIGNALGYVWQKKGHLLLIQENEMRKMLHKELKPLISHKIWLIGFVVCLIGSISTAVAFKFGAQSVLSPLSALVLVCNAILANKILHEPFTRNNLYGIILVIFGTVVAIIFGPKSSTDPLTLSYIESCWKNHIFLIFFIVLTLLLFIDYILVKRFEKKNAESIEISHTIEHGANFVMISYISIAAYCGSVNVLFVKSVMILLADFSVSYFEDYLFYVTIIGIVVVNVTLEYFRQRAIKFFDATYVVPIFQVLLILGATIMGAIFFNEFAALSTIELTVFISAIFIIVTGVAVLAFEIGAAYKQMLKKINEKVPQVFQFFGPTSAMNHYHMISKLRIVIDDVQFTTISTLTPLETDKVECKSWTCPTGGFPDIDGLNGLNGHTQTKHQPKKEKMANMAGTELHVVKSFSTEDDFNLELNVFPDIMEDHRETNLDNETFIN